MYWPLRRGERIRVARIGCWNGTAPMPALQAIVGRVGVVVARPGYQGERSRAHGEASYTVFVEGFGEVRLKPDEIEPVGRR